MKILSGKYKGKSLKTFKGDKIRPTSGMLKESVFNICRELITDACFLDLFAGTGAVGLEALSRGAAEVVFVDSAYESTRIIQENLRRLVVKDSVKIIMKNAFCALKQLSSMKYSFNLIYIDPPYGISSGIISGLLEQIVIGELLRSDGIIFVETLKDCTFSIPPGLNKKRFRKIGSSGLTEYIMMNKT